MRLYYSSSVQAITRAVIERIQNTLTFPLHSVVIVQSGARANVLKGKIQSGISPNNAIVTWEQLVAHLYAVKHSGLMLSREDALEFLWWAWRKTLSGDHKRAIAPIGFLQKIYHFWELWQALPPAKQQAIEDGLKATPSMLWQVYQEYQQLLGSDFVDGIQARRACLDVEITQHPHWRSVKHIIIDVQQPLGFIHQQFIETWQAHLEVECFIHFGENASVFEDMLPTWQWATELATEAPQNIENPLPISQAFLQLESSPQQTTHLFFVQKPNRLQEVYWVARKIRQLVVDNNWHWHAIGITAMDMARYAPVLENVFQEFAIPLASAPYKRLAENPLVQTMVQWVACAALQEPVSLLTGVLESPFLGYQKQLQDVNIQAALQELRLPGNVRALADQAKIMGEYLRHSLEEDAPEGTQSQLYFTLANVLQSMAAELDRLKQCTTPQQFASWFIQFIEDHALLNRSVRQMEALSPVRAIDNFHALRELITVLDTWQKRHAHQHLTLHDFFQILQLLVHTHGYRNPGRLEGGVQWVSAEVLPNEEFKALFVLGMSEANFPEVPQTLPPEAPAVFHHQLLEDALVRQRRWLVSISENPEMQVYFSVPMREGEVEQIPSTYLQELMRVTTIQDISETPLPVPDADTWQDVLFIQWETNPVSENPEAPIQVPVKQIQQAITIIHQQETPTEPPGIFEANLGAIPEFLPFIEERLKRKVFSPSAIELYAMCPMRYFLTYELGMPEEQPREGLLTPLERGNLVHRVLYRFFTEVEAQRRSEQTLKQLAEEELRRLPLPGNFLRLFVEQEFLGNAGQQGLFSQAFEDLMALQEVLSEFNLTHIFAEQPFGFARHQESWPVLKLALGEDVVLFRGKIDRVDWSPQGGFFVLDYKTGNAPSASAVAAGEKIQIPVYMQAVMQHFPEAGMPVGGGYLEVKANNNRLKLYFLENEGATKIKDSEGNSLSLEEVLKITNTHIAAWIHQMRLGHFSHTPDTTQCRHCAYAMVCRRQPAKQKALARHAS